MKTLVFEIFGDYGHFKTFCTNVSPITYPFPPPSTVAGMLGAICGIDKQNYLKVFSLKEYSFALRIMSPIIKERIGFNYIDTKKNFYLPIQHTQIIMDCLKNPHFRIYLVKNNGEIDSQIIDNIQHHKFFYTFSMGLAFFLADFKYIGLFDIEKKFADSSYVDICSVIPEYQLKSTSKNDKNIEFENNKKYLKAHMPIKIKEDRSTEEFKYVFYEANGQTIKSKNIKYYKVSTPEGEENVVLF